MSLCKKMKQKSLKKNALWNCQYCEKNYRVLVIILPQLRKKFT